MAAVLCLLLEQSTCNSLFLFLFAHHTATEWFRALQSLIIILGAYVALRVFYRRYLVNPHTAL